MTALRGGAKKTKKKKRAVLFVDLGSARDLQTIMKIYDLAHSYGNILSSYLYAEEKDLTLISTMSSDLEKKGFEVKVTIGPNEITMALDIVETAYNKNVDMIIVCTRKNTLIPAFVETKKHDKKLIIVAPISAPTSLEEVADEIEVV